MTQDDHDDIELVSSKLRELIREYWRGHILNTALQYESVADAIELLKRFDEVNKGV